MNARTPNPKQWPFVETPGEFTERLAAAMREFPTLLAAVRYVLIETPPTLASGMQGMEAPSKCDWPVCAVHHPCERKCEREPEKAECRRLWAEEDGRKRAATSPNEGGKG
jgi:hypothetical protein